MGGMLDGVHVACGCLSLAPNNVSADPGFDPDFEVGQGALSHMAQAMPHLAHFQRIIAVLKTIEYHSDHGLLS